MTARYAKPVWWTRRPGHQSRVHRAGTGGRTACGRKIPPDHEARVLRDEMSHAGMCASCWDEDERRQ